MSDGQSQQPDQNYRGRFAPSPTGPLHFGSLVTAVGSYLQARSRQGSWLVRMEDIDPPREMPGAADDILRTLEAFHLYWDGSVVYQSRRYDAYAAALDHLQQQGHTFPCACTRKTINKVNLRRRASIYPGTCRQGLAVGVQARAVRIRVPDQDVTFQDPLQGQQSTPLARDVGDFVIHRADGLYAYHLAVVVDDAEQQISEIVRGADLLSATAPQYFLQSLLGMPHPQYAHLPIAVNSEGEKLSKQTHARAVEAAKPGPQLRQALMFLGHTPPADIDDTPHELLSWAVDAWQLSRVPKRFCITADPSIRGLN